MGYPCPETMELSPIGSSSTATKMGTSSAECRCPPGTAQHEKTSKCHTLFERGPCTNGQYFSPIIDAPTKSAM